MSVHGIALLPRFQVLFDPDGPFAASEVVRKTVSEAQS
jgi:hypothetical protein